jgi:hypothetical protein
MARLQILELPEGAGDDRPPFILVVDQYAPQRIVLGVDTPWRDYWQDIADKIGARGVIVTPETVDIPANDTTAYLAAPAAEQKIVVDLAGQEPQGAIDAAIREAKDGLRLAEERTEIARDMDRLAKWKHELADALGIDRLRDWDDIRNAATGLRRERDAQAAAAQRVRDLHRPVEHRGQTICWACSDYDFPGQTTDSPPVAYDQCLTLKALAGYPAPDA